MKIFENIRRGHFGKILYNWLNPYGLNVPPAHYYSPIPDKSYILEFRKELFEDDNESGLDLCNDKHLEYLKIFKELIKGIPFTEKQNKNHRYYYENNMYGQSSGSLLYCMIKHLKPKNIIEVGSGFSSALMLDVNNTEFDNSIKLTFVEPHTERLKKLLYPVDYSFIKLIEEKLEEVDLDIFNELNENDILFIDSTHVSKIGSDVNTLIFKVLPRLKKGVFIHVHDIFFPFEYPINWIENGIFWNELYLLKAFLMYNSNFEIEFMNTYAFKKFEVMKEMPQLCINMGGCIWIKKTA